MPAASAHRFLVLLFGCAGGVFAGCSPSAPPATKPAHVDHDHDHGDHGHDHPTTLTAGIAALSKAAAAVADHLAADAGEEADEAVHELGHLLEDLQGLVRKEKIPAAAQAAAQKSIDDLFECFDKLDTALHAEPGSGESPKQVHASVVDRIEAALRSLREAARTPVVEEDEAAAIISSARETKED